MFSLPLVFPLDHFFFLALLAGPTGVEQVGETALVAILAIEMGRHENSGSALLVGVLASQAVDLVAVVDGLDLGDVSQLEVTVIGKLGRALAGSFVVR